MQYPALPQRQIYNHQDDVPDELYYDDEMNDKELEDMREYDNKCNAKLASFRNIMTMQTVGNYLKYLVGAGKASLDAKLFLLNRQNSLVQDIFNMADIKMMRKLRGMTLEGVKHVFKFFISPGIFNDHFTLRKNHPMCPKNIYSNGGPIKVDFSEIMPTSLLEQNSVYIMIRFLINKKLSSFEKKLCKLLAVLLTTKSPGHQEKEAQNAHAEIMQEKTIEGGLAGIYQLQDSHAILSKQDSRFSHGAGLPFIGPYRFLYVNANNVPNEMRELVGEILKPDERAYFDSIIIHFHGGGFMAMSSSSHQVYLRKWVRKIDIPVFSVEYRLAPQTKFPFVLNDCIRSYLWILTMLESVLGCKVRKVIVAGDSAGGNLALGLTSWCIEHGFRKPDLLELHYPAVTLDPYTFSPSLLYSIEDYLLHYNVMIGILQMYLPPNSDHARNYYISPVSTPDNIAANFPPCDFFVCERDPLRDGAIKLAARLM